MKSSRIIFWIITAVVLATVYYIVSESLSQPGLERFKGKIEERGFYRNENNTGPVLRVFAAEVIGGDLALMKEYGDAMPHTKYGKTIVFFLEQDEMNSIEISSQSPYLPVELQSRVLATYSKSPMGEASIVESFVP
ncbi:hypothetical protein ACFOSV_00330 [Algoriphagus namhaensis]|uniref:DUF1330 domain-containing protein n=1 Tax=Algoriphagus namhaensis TaxID=915353 RepID=A0ABV8AL26_9BACT